MPRTKARQALEPVLRALMTYRRNAGPAHYAMFLQTELDREAIAQSLEEDAAEATDNDILVNALLFYAAAENHHRANNKVSEVAKDAGRIARNALDEIGRGHLYETETEE